MNENQQLLKDISATASTGMDAISSLLPEVTSKKMQNTLLNQLDHYRQFSEKSGTHPKKSLMHSMAKMSIKMQTKMNPSSSHIASMMIQGSEMGIIKLQKSLNHHPNASKHTRDLAEEMIQYEQKTIDAYKPFL